MEQKHHPDYSLEEAVHGRGVRIVAGVDEAGRGPWAGPVVAAAVVLGRGSVTEGLDDSKRLSSWERERLFNQITETADYGIGIADVARVDEMNILQATLWSMQEAVGALSAPPDFVLVDGNKLPDFGGIASEAVVKGDQRSLSIAAASIVAKVTRDRLMKGLGEKFPEYCWASNKGYGTKAHQDALLKYGVTPHHRRSFKPIKALL